MDVNKIGLANSVTPQKVAFKSNEETPVAVNPETPAEEPKKGGAGKAVLVTSAIALAGYGIYKLVTKGKGGNDAKAAEAGEKVTEAVAEKGKEVAAAVKKVITKEEALKNAEAISTKEVSDKRVADAIKNLTANEPSANPAGIIDAKKANVEAALKKQAEDIKNYVQKQGSIEVSNKRVADAIAKRDKEINESVEAYTKGSPEKMAELKDAFADRQIKDLSGHGLDTSTFD